MPIATLLLKGGLLAAMAAVLIRGCSPELDVASEEPVSEAGAEQTPEPTPEPTPPPFLLSDLEPFAADDPRAEAADQLRRGLAAFEAGDFQGAVAALDASRTAAEYAVALRSWIRGDALHRLGRFDEADAAWAAVPGGSMQWPESLLSRAKLALEQDRPADALVLLGESGAPRPAGSEAGAPEDRSFERRADVLRARALRARGADGDELAAYRACVRVWITSTGDTANLAEAEACMDELEDRVAEDARPGLAQRIERAVTLGGAGHKNDVIDLLDDQVDELDDLASTEPQKACPVWRELGRAWHKKKKYGRSVPVLEKAIRDCPKDSDEQIRSRYLLAQGLARAGRTREAIAAWTDLSDAHPEHSYADDGLYHASLLYTEQGNIDAAQATLTSMASRFPDGDMVAAGMWQMAWTSLAADNPADAIPWLEQQAAGDPRGPNRERVLQGRYWLARARAETAIDEAALEAALTELEAIAEEHPLNWYGVLSAWRIVSVDEERGRRLGLRVRATFDALASGVSEPDTFDIQDELRERSGLQEAIELVRGGLGEHASLELRRALGDDAHETWDRETLLFASHLLERADDLYNSHHILRLAFRQSYPRPIADNRALLLHGYPLAFHDLVEQVAAPHPWPAMVFQGLVREESAYSPTIVSYAGARGLSQLMWPTAKGTARKMGRRIKRTDLDDPLTNLEIGSTYFQEVSARWGHHLPLAMGSYNAGPGAVRKWVDARGDLELDAWTETIPYKQTRLYVKKVTQSWQTYEALYGDGFPFVPLRTGPVRAAIDGEDPRLDLPSAD